MTYYSKCHNDCLFFNLLLFLCFKYNKEFIYCIVLREWSCCQKEFVYSNLIFHINTILYFIYFHSSSHFIHPILFYQQLPPPNSIHSSPPILPCIFPLPDSIVEFYFSCFYQKSNKTHYLIHCFLYILISSLCSSYRRTNQHNYYQNVQETGL